jgi:hypothetical protein
MVGNYNDEDKQSAPENIDLFIDHIPSKKCTLTHYPIDNEHRNSGDKIIILK